MFLYIRSLNEILNTDHIVSVYGYNDNVCPKIYIRLINGNVHILYFDDVDDRDCYFDTLKIDLGARDV